MRRCALRPPSSIITPPHTLLVRPQLANPGYPIFNAIIAQGNAITAGPNFPLTGAVVSAAQAIGTTEDTAAVSLVDFNNFRVQVVDVINILDLKIREILAVNAPVCP